MRVVEIVKGVNREDEPLSENHKEVTIEIPPRIETLRGFTCGFAPQYLPCAPPPPPPHSFSQLVHVSVLKIKKRKGRKRAQLLVSRANKVDDRMPELVSGQSGPQDVWIC